VTGDDAISLTALLCDFGGLWEITKTARGYTAHRRPVPAPPLVFTAATVPALRELLEHGYDTAELADLLRGFAVGWDIERLDPGSVWVAVSRDSGLPQVITASDLGSLRTKLSRGQGEMPGTMDHLAARLRAETDGGAQ
jgi:hypothetical protein